MWPLGKGFVYDGLFIEEQSFCVMFFLCHFLLLAQKKVTKEKSRKLNAHSG